MACGAPGGRRSRAGRTEKLPVGKSRKVTRSKPVAWSAWAPLAGLPVLRQPFGEPPLGFLCTATKQIVQIKQMLALLAERHGAEICRASVLQTPLDPSADNGVCKTDALQSIHRLPTWPELAEIPE